MERQKRQITLDDLRTLKPGESQRIPFDLWAAYQKRDHLVVAYQGWDRIHHCPIVYAGPDRENCK